MSTRDRKPRRLPEPIIRFALRHFGRPVLRPGTPRAVQRFAADAGGLLSSLPRGTRVRSQTVGGVAGQWVSVPGSAPDRAVLHLHGGGFVTGSSRSHRGFGAELSAAVGAPVFLPDYRRVPEHPHAAALADAGAAFDGLLELGFDPARVAVSGDSAGGGLALALAMERRDAGLPQPAVVALVCPWLDLTVDVSGTRRENLADLIIRTSTPRYWASLVARTDDVSSQQVSPARGELDGLAPIVAHLAGDDPLTPDSDALVRAAAAGLDVEVECFEGMWHDFHLQSDRLVAGHRAMRKLGAAISARLAAPAPPLHVAIIGAGASGLCMAHKLREAGHRDVTIFEKGDEVGGTWRENRYPGLTCDVPSRFYSYSFAPNPGWSRGFSPGAEIQDYFVRTTDELGLRDLIRFGEEVTEARWTDGRWSLRTASGREETADVVVTATGILHHPKTPAVPGLETFAGRVAHSARWDSSIDVAGQRVGVIGTGSTGAQITSALAGEAGHLTVFQRTAQWILPLPNHRYLASTRAAFRRIPSLNRLAHRGYQRLFEATLGTAVLKPGWQRSSISALVRLNLRFGVRDPDLRQRLTPDYEPMCKRLIMSAGFYPALQRDTVSLVTDAVARVEPEGIVTSDGRLHELDLIITATGFDAHAYMRPMQIVGPGGHTLDEAWADGPRAYRTVALPGFPNLFTLLGPHSPIGNQSIIAVVEAQAAYVVQWVGRLQRGELAHVTPRADVSAAYHAKLREAAKGTVFGTGCASWYLDADGVPEVWPWSPEHHRRILREPEPQDFDLALRGAGDRPPEGAIT